jgi:hypothetical protein
MHGVSVRTVCLTLAALTVPAATGFIVYGYGRAWTFMPPIGEMLLAMGLTGLLPAIFLMVLFLCAWEVGWFALLGVRSRRVKRGRCWRCGYQQAVPPIDPCTECGTNPSAVPTERYPRTSTVVALLVFGCAASAMDALVAEWHVTNEDARFIERVRSTGRQQWMGRDRAWPYRGFSTVFNPPYGFHVND